MDTTHSWTKITSYVRGFKTVRAIGQPGAIQLTLDNTDGRFDPTFAGGAYDPDIVPMVAVRIQAAFAETVGEVGSGSSENQVGTAKVEVGTADVFNGFITSWPQTWRGLTDPVVQAKGVDGSKLFNLLRTDATTFIGAADSRAQIKALLRAALWPAEWIDGYAGDSGMQEYVPVCVSILEGTRRVKDSEAGWFFLQADGHSMFHPRSYRAGLASSYTFGDSSELDYVKIRFPFDDTQIWNNVTVTPTGGTAQNSQDATSIGKYGDRALPVLDSLNATDADALVVAAALKTRYKDPLQAAVVTLKPSTLNGLWPAVLTADLGHKVTVKRRTQAGNTGSFDGFIENISHFVTPGEWVTELRVSQYA